MSADDPDLRAVLARAQGHGAIGPGPIEQHIAHALGFFGPGGVVVGTDIPVDGAAVDLGSGGGLPGLPLALAYPRLSWTLLDAWGVRVDQLTVAIRALGLSDRVRAVHARAEEWARGAGRGATDVVVARSFAPPSRTAECGAPLLRPGGWLVVSAAPDVAWPDAIPELALAERREWRRSTGRYVAYRTQAVVPDRYPRRPPAQARQPLF